VQQWFNNVSESKCKRDGGEKAGGEKVGGEKAGGNLLIEEADLFD